MNIWCENNSDDLYQAILHNKQINVDIGDNIDDSPIIPVTINTYDKTNNNFIHTYTHALSVIQIINYCYSFLRFNKTYDFEIIRLDEINDEIHKEQSIELLTEALQEYQIIKNAMAETFNTQENKIIYSKACNIVDVIQNKIDEIKIGNNKEDSLINND